MLTKHQISQMKWEAQESGARKRWTHEAIIELVNAIEHYEKEAFNEGVKACYANIRPESKDLAQKLIPLKKE